MNDTTTQAPERPVTADGVLDRLRAAVAAYKKAGPLDDDAALLGFAYEAMDAAEMLDNILVAGASLPKAWVAREWTVRAAEEFAAGLDGNSLDRLLGALNEENGGRGNENIVELVREFIADEYGPYQDHEDMPIAVVFETDEWDDGFYLDDRNATVFFAYGSHDEGVEIAAVRDVMTETYGKVGPKAMLGVDLRTGQIEYGESGADVCLLLDIKDLETARQSEGPDDNRAPAKN